MSDREFCNLVASLYNSGLSYAEALKEATKIKEENERKLRQQTIRVLLN